jgi:sodium pump decarboxylase gamma subunit
LNELVLGFTLLVVGMTVLFLAMGLLILVMIALDRLFRTRKLVPDEQEPTQTETVSRHARNTADEQVVAAIALALAHLRSLEISQSGLGTALEDGHGSWWTMGQAQQRPTTAYPPLKPSPSSQISSPGASDIPQGRRK